MSGRFPGAGNVEEYWRNLRGGVESITFFSDEELNGAAVAPGERFDPAYVRARGILEGVEDFDASFFDFTPREAQLTDPQHRIFLECVSDALENAGYDPRGYPGAIGLFAGGGVNSYLLFHLAASGQLDGTLSAFQAFLHNKHDHLTTRVAYKLNLRGPCLTVQTACSTSLVATALACQSLTSFQCDMALAGGVSVFVPQQTGYLYHQGGIGSPDGHCRPFDAQAAGTLGGNGAGVVVLKRLDDALAEGDTVHAVIEGWALNNDGARKVGYTAPGVDSQAEVIATAHAFAGISPDTIAYVEAHGTGTTLGDPIEVEALKLAFRRGSTRRGFCALGSVKSNIGHLDAAAGVAGLIKTVLALSHREIPPSLHFSVPNPRINFADTPFYVPSTLVPWEANGTPRRAAVSSFGLGGTNAHVVLEEAPPVGDPAPSAPHQLLVLSAQSVGALETATSRLLEHFKVHPEQSLADVAYTLQVGRAAFQHRRTLVARDREDALALLRDLTPTRVATGKAGAESRRVTFLFPGQGAQYLGMGAGLYATESIYRAEVDHSLELLAPHLDCDLRALLQADPGDPVAGVMLQRTVATQPALFVVEYALAKLWMHWGINPAAMLGHSVGEYVAATLAGVLSLEDALSLVAARGALIQALPGGAMLAVPLPESKARLLLDERTDLAAVNADELCVISGPVAAIDGLQQRLAKEGITARLLHTSHAFHSGMMDPMLDAFRARVRAIRLRTPSLPYLSNVSGTWITREQATDPEYWVRHLRQTVRFHDAVGELIGDPNAVLLEVGPGRTLRSVVRWHPGKRPGQVMAASLRHAHEPGEDHSFLLQAVGQLWLAGLPVNWQSMHRHKGRRRVPLPTYPYQRTRHWIDAAKHDQGARPARSLERNADVGDWFWVPVWKETPRTAALPPADDGGWLLFGGQRGLAALLVERLRSLGRRAVIVHAGQTFREVGPDRFEIDPTSPKDYGALMQRLAAGGRLPRHILHLWSAESDAKQVLDHGLYSLIWLAGAIGAHETSAVDLLVVTSGMQDVVGGDLTAPEQATVLGPCRVIGREYPHVSCRSVDLALSPSGTEDLSRLVEQLIIETAAAPAAAVAFRSGRRWVQDYQMQHLPPAGNLQPPLRAGGVYLITGGLGGIGLEVAGWLARQVGAKLVLTSRSAFPPRDAWNAWLAAHEATDATSRRIRSIQRLEALGAEVMVARADAADEAGMLSLVDEVIGRFGDLHGVVHAAGVAAGARIAAQTPENMAGVLAPKVRGARVLERVLADRSLDFLVLCSSRTAVMGRFGQVDYTAANAFLDAFASYYQAATGTWTVTVDWGRWEQVGMAAQGPPRRDLLAGVTVRTCGHPMLERCILEEPGHAIYATDFSVAKHWPLDEHRILGRAAMPGVAFIEMVRAALAERAGRRVVVIREIFFMEPMHLDDDEVREGRLELQEETPGEYSFKIWSWERNDPAGRMRRHALGQAGFQEPQAAEYSDLGEIIARCPRTVTIAEEDREDTIGPRWQSVHRLHVGSNELVVELEVPQAFQEDWAQWFFHPAVMDRAAGLTKAHLAPEHYYLPMSYRGLALAHPLRGKLYAHGRFHPQGEGEYQTIVFDFNLLDECGKTVLRVERFTQKRINDPAAHIRGVAEAYALEGGVSSSSDGISPEEGIDALARILDARVTRQVVVSPNDLHAAIEESDVEAAERLFSALPDGAHAGSRAPRPELSSSYVAPGTEVERRMTEIWSNVLGVDVGVKDNFFELGGDSVQAIQIMAKAKRMGLNLTPQEFFQYETIAGLAEILERGPRQEAPAAEISAPGRPLAEPPEPTVDPESIRRLAILIEQADRRV
jgi:acyl transferase domain-containing protein